jgi:hypothetical protein
VLLVYVSAALEASKICDMMFQPLDVRTSTHTIMGWDLTYPYKIQVVQMFSAANKQWRCEFCLDFFAVCVAVPCHL